MKNRSVRSIDIDSVRRTSSGASTVSTAVSGMDTHDLNGVYHRGLLAWAQLDKSGSSLSEITTRTHALLTGLSADDHTQYHTDARAATWGDARYLQLSGGTVSGDTVFSTKITVPVVRMPAANTFTLQNSSGTSQVFVNTSGYVGLGTSSQTHRIEFISDTTEAGGIGFGSDTAIYRSAAGTLSLGASDSLVVPSGEIRVTGSTTDTATSTDLIRIGNLAGRPSVVLEDGSGSATVWAISNENGALTLNNSSNAVKYRFDTSLMRIYSSISLQTDNFGVGTGWQISYAGVAKIGENTDAAHRLGMAGIGYVGVSGEAAFSHRLMAAAGDYAIKQNSSGQTAVNSKTGQTTIFSISNTTVADLTASAIRLYSSAALQTDNFSTSGVGWQATYAGVAQFATSVKSPLISSVGDLTLTPGTSNVVLTDAKAFKSTTYTSGWAGSGFRLDYNQTLTNVAFLELDSMSIRGTLSVYELLINQIRATNGTEIVSSAAKVASVSGNVWTFEDADGAALCPFASDDIVIIQRATVTSNTLIKRVVRKVASVSGASITVTTATGGPGDTGNAAKGDTVVRIGNETNAARRGVVLLTSDMTGGPYIDVVDGVALWSDWGSATKNKVRLGNLSGITDSDFGGTLSGYGLYSGNAYLRGGLQVLSHVSVGSSTWQAAGIQLQYNAGAPRLYVGNGSTQYLQYLAGALTISGTVTATAGAIGGWTINSTNLAATNINIVSGAANTARIEAGLSTTWAGINAPNASGDIAFWAGSTHANRATAPLNITAGGALVANSATVTGAINASSGSITGTMAISGSGKLTVGSDLELSPSGMNFTTDNYASLSGITSLQWWSNLASQTGSPDMQLNIGKDYGVGGSGLMRAFLEVSNGTNGNDLNIEVKGTYGASIYLHGSGASSYISLTASSININSNAVWDVSFTGVTFNTGWSNYGNSWFSVAYTKLGSLVNLRGLALAGSSPGAHIFILPTGFRPNTKWLIVTAMTSQGAKRIDIKDSGDFTPTGWTPVNGDWVSLDGISFFTN